MVVSPQGQPSTLLIYASTAKLKFSFSFSSLMSPVHESKHEPESVDGINVLQCANAKHPF